MIDPDQKLSKNWRTSSDRAVTTSGDETGLHLLVAEERNAYKWRNLATLAEPGWLTDQWIGQFCVTGSGQRAVVVYGPRQFTNKEELMDRGGFVAVVDLTSGAVTKLGRGASLAYYSPGCGSDETAVVSRLESTKDSAQTWLGVIDAKTGKVVREARTGGQLTSAVPFQGEVVAARGATLVAIDRQGKERTLAATGAAPFRIHPDHGGLAFQTADATTVRFKRYAGKKVIDVGSAPVGSVKLRPGAGGRVFLTGRGAKKRFAHGLPGGWGVLDNLPDADISTTGAIGIARATTGKEAAGRTDLKAGIDGATDMVDIEAYTAGGQAIKFTVKPGAAAEQVSSGEAGVKAQSIPPYDFSNVPWDPDRSCAVSRNDPAIQTYQPSFTQVEWAANLAVYNRLTFQRPANWSNNNLPAYSPQGLFPTVPLVGGGTVPAQVYLAILAQESNLWQASFHTVDGSAGNPLTSLGYYGLDLEQPDFDYIDWTKTDCGYGVAQVTTGMKMSDTNTVVDGITITDLHQKAVALDYATNIAAGLRILQTKWNQTRSAGLIANDGDPRYIENWWFAVWAYNTGFYPNAGDGSPWGVGWSNNPSNPKYPADRQMFLTAPLDVPDASPPIDDEIGYDNAKHPNHWSYPERVMGFAYKSLIKTNYNQGGWGPTYQTAKKAVNGSEFDAQPDRFTFCEPGVNQCDPTQLHQPADHPTEKPGPCLRDDLKCWWHTAKTWTDCVKNCGLENLKYSSVEPRPLITSIYPSQCSTTGLPAGAKIVDDIYLGRTAGPSGCNPNWTRGGSFSLKFGENYWNGQTIYPSKVDFHQIGAGFGGHFWFAHTRKDTPSNQPMKVTGTWKIDPTNAWTRVLVHMPDHGAHTQQAHYVIKLPNGQERKRVVPTQYEKNSWVDLGVFDFTGPGQPSVELSNFTLDGGHNRDVAWDALAVQSLPSKPAHFVVNMGDSYSSGEGVGNGNFTRVSDQYGDDEHGEGSRANGCRRSNQAWSRLAHLPGYAAMDTIGKLADQFSGAVDYHNVACSGARHFHVISKDTYAFTGGTKGEPQYGELNQMDQGFLDTDTTLVTITIGGNDAGFSKVLQGCVTGTACPDEAEKKQEMDEKVKPAVLGTIAQIRQAAPNATIVLMGYPKLISGIPPCANPQDPLQINSGMLGRLAEHMETILVAAENQFGPKVQGVMAVPRFEGFGSCGLSTHASSNVNAFILDDQNGYDGDEYNWEDWGPYGAGMNMNSYHPNLEGQKRYAQLLSDNLPTFYP